MVRPDGRSWDQARNTVIIPGYQKFAEGSALIEVGNTRVLCSASLEERVPAFLRGRGYVAPEDVKQLAGDVLRHRVITTYEAEAESITSSDLVQRILDSVEVP